MKFLIILCLASLASCKTVKIDHGVQKLTANQKHWNAVHKHGDRAGNKLLLPIKLKNDTLNTAKSGK